MWGKRKRTAAAHVDSIRAAQVQQRRADEVIAHVDSQDAEVKQLVRSLERRKQQNHFGEALMAAMARREVR